MIRQEPFGRLYQRDLDYLRLARFDASDRLLFSVIHVRAGAGVLAVNDRITTLADWTGLSARKVQASLASLARRGVISRERRAIAGGAKGHAWRWTTGVRPYEEWPTEPLLTVIATAMRSAMWSLLQGKRAQGVRALAEEAERKRRQESTEEDAQNEGRGRTTTRHNPERPPDLLQERNDLHVSADAKDAGIHLARRLGKYWVSDREDAGLERFTDLTAARWIAERVPLALEAGCSETDITVALEDWARKDFADPRNLVAWATAERDDRLRTEREIARSREWAAQRDREQAELARKQTEPGYQEEVAAILAKTRAALGRAS